MSRYIDAEKLKRFVEELKKDAKRNCCDSWGIVPRALEEVEGFITSLQQEQPMPDSTKLIELWHEDKEMLKEKDFRDDPWRLAYNAFMCGFGRGIAVNKQEQPEVDLDALVNEAFDKYSSVDGYGQLSVSFNRAELYSFIKKIARNEK